MKTISILNLKGGVAKTFTAANMAYELYRRGYKVLLIDNDSQASLTKAMGVRLADCKVTLDTLMCQTINSPELLAGSLACAIQHQNSLDLIPANQKLSGIATRLSVNYMAENIISGTTSLTPVLLMNNSMQSSGHRAWILSDEVDSIEGALTKIKMAKFMEFRFLEHFEYHG